MQAIIKQNSQAPTLPDLRNLGTVLRILLAVNGAAIVVAFAGEPRWGGMSNAWAVLAAYVEPQLLADLAIFWLLQPALQRMPYPAGCATVTGIVAAVTLGFHGLIDPGLPLAPSTLLRELVFSVTVTAALLYYFQLRAKALSPAIAEARLQALQARIRPHFLFNSLNAVLSLIRSEPDRAEAALEDLAELFRVLMRDNRELAPLADEVNLCRQYLDLEKLRLGERLVVEWNVKSMPDDALVPPLVLQPLLENAVYHGIEPSSSPGVLSINIFGSRDGAPLVNKATSGIASVIAKNSKTLTQGQAPAYVVIAPSMVL